MKKILIIITLSFFSGLGLFAQDAAFSQFYSSELYLNPALAGEEQNLTFASNFRSQWRSVSLPYVTNQVSLIVPIFLQGSVVNHLGGVGISAYNDRAGDGNFNTTGVNINLAYNLPLSYSGVFDASFGLQVGFVQKAVDFTNLAWGEQFNPFIGFDANQVPTESQFQTGRTYPDISAGFVTYYNPASNFKKYKWKGFIGASTYHINRPNESFVDDLESRLPLLLKVHGGLEFKVTRKIHLSPNFLYQRQNNIYQLNLGNYLTYKLNDKKNGLTAQADLIVGAWYRFRDAAIISLGVGTPYYTIGISYDQNTSTLRRATRGRGAYEVSLTLHRLKRKTSRRQETPRI